MTFEDIKAMFDPVMEIILQLIHTQLNAISNCETIFLIGGFSQSKYLQSRIKKEFSRKVNKITVPRDPSAIVARGGEMYD